MKTLARGHRRSGAAALRAGREPRSDAASALPVDVERAILGALALIVVLAICVGDLGTLQLLPRAIRAFDSFGPLQAGFVLLFLGGYQSAASLARHDSAGWAQRRVIRIYPLYFAALVFGASLFAFFGSVIDLPLRIIAAPQSVAAFLAPFALLEAFWAPLSPASCLTATLVAVMVVCNLVTPILSKQRSRTLLALAAVSLALAYYGTAEFVPAAAFIWAWIAGMLYCRHRGSLFAAWSAISVVALGCGEITSMSSAVAPSLSFAAMAVATNAYRMTLPRRFARVLGRASSITLSMLLLHYPVYLVVCAAWPAAPWYAMIGSAIAAGILGVALIAGPYQRYVARKEGAGATSADNVEPIYVAESSSDAPLGAENPVQWQVLGALRLFLAVVVVANHLFQVVAIDSMPYWMRELRNFGGTEAVYCFFLISGYSIAASIERDRSSFARRRVWRLAPVYLFCFLFALLPSILHGDAWHSSQTGETVSIHWGLPLLLEAIGASHLITPSVGLFGMTWSLTAEITYYMFAPLFARARPIVLWMCIALSGAAYIGINHTAYGINLTELLYEAPAATLAWLWIAAFLYHRYWRQHGLAIAVFAMTMAMPLFDLSGGSHARLELFATVSLVVAAPYMSKLRLPRLAAKAGVWAGDLSYPLYLSHMATVGFIYIWLTRFAYAHMGIYIAAPLAVAAVILTVVDYPTRRLARRLHHHPASIRYSAGHLAAAAQAASSAEPAVDDSRVGTLTTE